MGPPSAASGWHRSPRRHADPAQRPSPGAPGTQNQNVTRAPWLSGEENFPFHLLPVGGLKISFLGPASLNSPACEPSSRRPRQGIRLEASSGPPEASAAKAVSPHTSLGPRLTFFPPSHTGQVIRVCRMWSCLNRSVAISLRASGHGAESSASSAVPAAVGLCGGERSFGPRCWVMSLVLNRSSAADAVLRTCVVSEQGRLADPKPSGDALERDRTHPFILGWPRD